MKKILLLLLSALLLPASSAQGIELQPTVGFGLSRYASSDKIDQTRLSLQPAFQIGGEMLFDLSTNLRLSAGVAFSLLGSKLRITYSASEIVNGAYRLSGLALPVLLKFGLGRSGALYMIAGPEFFLAFSHKLKLAQEAEAYDLKETTSSLGVGAGIGLGKRLSLGRRALLIELRYTLGLSNLVKSIEKSHMSLSAVKLVVGIGQKKND